MLEGLTEAALFLRDRLAECAVSLKPKPTFKLFKTVKIGTGLRSQKDFNDAFKARKVRNNVALRHITIAEKEEELDLTLASASDFGHDVYSIYHFHELAFEAGLTLCPKEVGLQVLLQCTDDLPGNNIHVATSPIVHKRDPLLRIGKDEEKYLVISRPDRGRTKLVLSTTDFRISYGKVVHPGVQLLFVLPRKEQS